MNCLILVLQSYVMPGQAGKIEREKNLGTILGSPGLPYLVEKVCAPTSLFLFSFMASIYKSSEDAKIIS